MNKSAIILALLLSGCTVAPHGSRATHRVWTYEGRKDGLIRYEVITDRSAGGGLELLSSIGLANVVINHTNSLLQVGGEFRMGSNSITGDAASIDAIGKAIGDAAGSAAGTAARKAIGLP